MKITLENGTVHKLKVGDYFRWYYKDTKGMFEPYHCKSNLCKFTDKFQKSGELRDLFWSMGDDSNYGHLKLDNLELTFLGNINDYVEIREYEMAYYDDSDLMDISHSNHSKNCGGVFFVRKNAVHSKSKIKESIDRKLEDAKYKLKSAQHDIDYLQKKLTVLESCADLEKFYF